MPKQDFNVYNSFIKNYWRYYLELESDFLDTQKYVDFDAKNNSTFSIEYLKLLQAICGEIDCAAKEFAKYADSSFKVDKNTNINKWGYEIQKIMPQIQGTIVFFNGEEEIQPWKNWYFETYQDKRGRKGIRLNKDKNSKNPKFWTSYTSVKHGRMLLNSNSNDTNYKFANMKNVKYALAALFILEQGFADYLTDLKIEKTLDFEKSHLFRERIIHRITN